MVRVVVSVPFSISGGGFPLPFQVLYGNGKEFVMTQMMVNNEADLKLAKQEVAVMVRGGQGRGGKRQEKALRAGENSVKTIERRKKGREGEPCQ